MSAAAAPERADMPPKPPMLFGKFVITPQVFHSTALSMAFVNLKPLLPGHVLVSPRRVVPRLADLTAAEVADLFSTVQRVARTVERTYGATALNVALQDGADAGQSVPHVHAHIIPRRRQDLAERGGNDALYGLLEGAEGDVGAHLRERTGQPPDAEDRGPRPTFPKVEDASRKPRSDSEMEEEARMLAKEMGGAGPAL